MGVSHLNRLSELPLIISGKTVEKGGTHHSVRESMTIPSTREKVMQFSLNSDGTRGVGVWRNASGKLEILEWKPFRGTVEIVHHEVVDGKEYVFHQFPILDRQSWTRNLPIGASVRIFQAIS